MTAQKWPENHRRGVHLFLLLLLSFGCLLASVVDADNDPTTTNLPSAVIVTECRSIRNGSRTAEHETCGPDGRDKLEQVCHRLNQWLGFGQHGWRLRTRPIRGP